MPSHQSSERSALQILGIVNGRPISGGSQALEATLEQIRDALPSALARPSTDATVIGTWSEAVAYAVGEVVRAQDGADWIGYQCLVANTGIPPAGSPSHWQNLLTAGDPVALIGVPAPDTMGYASQVVRYQQDATGGTFDMGDQFFGMAYDADEATLNAALFGGPYVAQGNADNFTLTAAPGESVQNWDTGNLTGETFATQTTESPGDPGGFAVPLSSQYARIGVFGLWYYGASGWQQQTPMHIDDSNASSATLFGFNLFLTRADGTPVGHVYLGPSDQELYTQDPDGKISSMTVGGGEGTRVVGPDGAPVITLQDAHLETAGLVVAPSDPSANPAANLIATLYASPAPPTDGTFTLDVLGDFTDPIPFDADAPTVQAAIELLGVVGVGNVAVADGPLPADMTVEFIGALADTTLNAPIVDNTGLVGGGYIGATAQFGKPLGMAAPVPSLALCADGTLWVKTGAPDTGWQQVAVLP